MRDGRERSDEGGPGRGRRPPPPPATGEEDAFFVRARESGGPVIVHLVDRTEIRGRVLDFDREVVVIADGSGSPRVLRKAEVRYIADAS